MHALTPAARERVKLETLLHAATYYHGRLADELRRDDQRPEHMQAITEIRELWAYRMDVCLAEVLRLKEELAELAIDRAYQSPAAPPETVSMPKVKRTRRKATAPEVDYGT